jgi:hypothetical protein
MLVPPGWRLGCRSSRQGRPPPRGQSTRLEMAAVWYQAKPSIPVPSPGPAVLHHHRLVVYGGRDDHRTFGDLHVLTMGRDGLAWSRPLDVGPNARGDPNGSDALRPRPAAGCRAQRLPLWGPDGCVCRQDTAVQRPSVSVRHFFSVIFP